MSAAVRLPPSNPVEAVLTSPLPSSAVGRGSGRINCGWFRAVRLMRLYVSSGMTAQSERGSEACRRRQMYSTSLFGRLETFSRSRYADRGLMPGAAVLADGLPGFEGCEGA